jgi:hypothetical protein
MLRLAGGRVELLLDELPPVEVRELPADLAVLDRLLADWWLLGPARAGRGGCRSCEWSTDDPDSLLCAAEVIKQRTGWGYKTLVREVPNERTSMPAPLGTRSLERTLRP